MKFRTDFVTNSSSTSYISITFGYKDGNSEVVFDEDFDGECLSFLGFRQGKENISLAISSIDDVLKAIDLLYCTVSEEESFNFHVKNALDKEKDSSNVERIIIKTVNSDSSSETTQTLVADFKKKILTTSSVYENDDDDF